MDIRETFAANLRRLRNAMRLSERDILTHAGKISHDDAVAHAEAEFDKFKQQQLAEPSPVEVHFEQSLKELDQIETQETKSEKKER